MTRRRRLAVASSLTALVVLVAVILGEVGTRAAIDRRLANAAPGDATLSFAGRSGIIAAVTRRVPVSATFGSEALTDRLGNALDGKIDQVTFADGALGVSSDQGIGRFHRPVTAWLTLAPGPGTLVATVISLEVAGLQLQPSALLGKDLTFDIPDPVAERCGDATHVEGISISHQGLEIDFTATSDTMACLKTQEKP